jgi:non-ribosomal peptide synthetase component F
VAAEDPDGVALAVDGGERLTYGAWEQRSNAVAAALGTMVGAGASVALVFDSARWPEYAVAHVAVAKLGAAPVPILAGLGEIQVARILRDCRPSAVMAPADLAPADLAPADLAARGDAPRTDRVPVLDPAELEARGRALASAGRDDAGRHPPRSQPPEVLYVSRPLGPVAPHVFAPAGELGDAQPLLHAFPPGAIGALEALRGCLSGAGMSSVVLPEFDAERICALIEAEPERACGLHPAAAEALLASGATVRHDVTGLRRLVLAPGPVAAGLLARLADAVPLATIVVLDAPPGGARDPVALDPVAFSQEGMIWHELFAPGCQNLPGLARRYRGPLDIPALTRALDEIVRRHGALRTRFELRRGQLGQAVRPHEPLELEVRDLSALSAEDREQAVARRVADAGRRPFDLALDRLFVPTLLRLGDEDHVLIIRTHHSVFDDWSVGVFRRQLAKLYNAYAAGQPSPLPEPALQFAEFARRQRAELAGPAGDRELAFWRRELSRAPFTSQLAVDDPSRPAGTPQRGGETVSLSLPPELQNRLRTLARRERATLFMTILAAFGVLVRRYTGQDDLVLATVVANRNRTELEGLIGCFTKKVPFRLPLGGDPPFTDVLARTREHLMGALTHQDLPFETVIQDTLGAAAAAHGVVPHLALMFQGVTPTQELVLESVESAGLETAARAGRAHFMAGEAGQEKAHAELPPPAWGGGLYAGTFVIVSIDESRDELVCSARGAFHAPAVRGLLERFKTLLDSVAVDPGRPISELALIDERTRAEVSELGRGPAPARAGDTLAAELRAQLARVPAAVAVRTPAVELTFAELEERSEALAASLREAGAGRESRVATVLPASPELIVAVVAIWKAGAAWVGLDPEDAPERRGHIVQEAEAEILIGEQGLARGEGLARGQTTRALDGGQAARAVDPGQGDDRGWAGPNDAAVVFYGSSGSSAVVLDHGALKNLHTALRDASGGERHTSLCPGPTDDAFLRRLVAMLGGDPLYILERSARADPAAALALLAAGEADLLDATPVEVEALLHAGLADGLPTGLEAVVVIGARGPVSPELVRAAGEADGVRPYVLFGPPECGFAATGAASPVRGAGRPLAGVNVRVLDDRRGPVPIGATGELCVGGAGLARSEPGDREQPCVRDGERLYGTGLLARLLADGTVELLGALGGDVDLRGFRVDPERIESALAGCPGLGEVKVALERDGDGEPLIVATGVADGTPPTLAQLRAYLWRRLPGYALPARLVVSEAETDATERAGALPEENVLGALWAAELRVDRVGPEANYWQVFSFIDVLARAREAGVAVPGQKVTRNRTLGTLATALSAVRRP